MDTHHQAQVGYGRGSAPIRTPRGIEYEVFAKTTNRLRAAFANQDLGFPERAKALHENRELWTLLATNVANPDNALPAELRAQIFYLAEFTLHHSSLVLKGKAEIAPLLEINGALMQGLRSTVAAA